MHRSLCTAALFSCLLPSVAGSAEAPLTMSRVLDEATAADWRAPAADRTLYLELAGGRVIIELAEAFAPRHVANIRKLVRTGYFQGAEVLRVQDNYVVQWGLADETRSLGEAESRLAMEIERAYDQRSDFTPLGDVDVYAPEVGFSDGYPVARDPASRKMWLAHCYGMVGVGRGMEADSGNGSSLYAVSGHSPRHLDHNITLAGRVIHGMEILNSLPRGTGPLGFYEQASERTAIADVRLAADVPLAERTDIELLRTDTPSFARLIEARRHRRESWFLDSVGHVSLCNVPLPTRIR